MWHNLVISKKIMYEFCKLNPIDLKVASWLCDKHLLNLYSYLEFIASNDYRRKEIYLDVQKIFNELIEVHGCTYNLDLHKLTPASH